MDDLELAVRYHLMPPSTAFDVGANIGHFTFKMADLCRHVVAFEPNPSLAASLRSSARGNVTVVEAAASDREGVATFHIDNREGVGAVASSLLELSGMEDQTTPVEVRTITLDALCAREGYRPDLIKIDVEGFEAFVFAGARGLIRELRPVIVFEMWGGYYEKMLPTITWLSETHKLVRIGDGFDVSVCADTVGGNVEDILCIPLKP